MAVTGRICWGLALLTIVVASGCGGGNDNLARVSGTIKMDGKPLPNAFVQYIPTQGGTTSYGKTDENGYYEMVFSETAEGAWIGENRVEISTGDVGADNAGGVKEIVPVVYNRNTSLKADVKPGDNTFNFELESDAGEVVQLPDE